MFARTMWFGVALLVLAGCPQQEPEPATPTGPAVPEAERAATPAERDAAVATAPPADAAVQWYWSSNPNLYPLAAIAVIEGGARYLLEQPPAPSRSKVARLSRTNPDGTIAWTLELSPKGHALDGASIIVDDKAVYVASYRAIASGCGLSAYSIADGKKLWSVHLQGIGPVGHSQYRNRVQMLFEGDEIAIFGHESQGRYIEVRDNATGALLSNQKLPAASFLWPLSEAIYAELANRLSKRSSATVDLGDFLKRHVRTAANDEVRLAVGRLHNAELQGGAYRLRLELISGKAGLRLSAKRVKTAGACVVAVDGLADATIYRGPIPRSPYQRTGASKPLRSRRHKSLSHGDHHLRCTYNVTVNSKRYTYPHNLSNTGRIHDESHCTALQSTIPGEIVSFSHNCTDFAHGEFYGHRLIPRP